MIAYLLLRRRDATYNHPLWAIMEEELINTMDPKIAAALIVGAISILLFVVKDILFSFYQEFKSERKSKKVAFETYANPLLISIDSMLRRLEEIFELRSHYLLKDAVMNKFNSYKLVSTNYRFFKVLAWLRALNLEFDRTNNREKTKYQTIDNALRKVESSLADGQSLEIQILRELCRIWNYEIKGFNKKQLRLFGIELETIGYNYFDSNDKVIAKYLTKEKQIELLVKLSNSIANFTNSTPLSEQEIKKTKDEAIKEVSLNECWIYRDWQSAAGDYMLREITDNQRRFEVIGFSEFESDFNENQNIWIKRIILIHFVSRRRIPLIRYVL